VMLGIPPFFRAFAAPPTIEDRLLDRPEALAGLERVLCRAHRGARFALAFAVHRTDPHAATVHAAALLHEFAELLLWCQAPGLALRIESLQRADPAMRSSAAQRRVLNIELAELQQALASAWRLPSLLSESRHEPHAAHIGARAVQLGARVARHSAGGWDNAALPDDVAEVAMLLNLSPSAALQFLTEIDAS
jgi:HD-like signal output (HDOD) protein